MEATGRTWEEFLQANGLATELTKEDYVVMLRLLGDAANPNTGSNIVFPRKLMGLYKRVSVTAAALKECGDTAVILLAAPGAGYFVDPYRIILTRAGDGVLYDFSDYLSIQCVGGEPLFILANDIFNPVGELNRSLVKQGQQLISNAALILTLINGAAGNATVGDGDIDIEVYYTIHNTKV